MGGRLQREMEIEADPGRPVLIYGPTASGKSALALDLAERQGRAVVNADALQVYAEWRVLSARPSPEEEARAPHLLYGTVRHDEDWSVGHWLRAVGPLLDADPAPVIVGGTGLYMSALTEGLAEIPPVPPEVRAEADARRAVSGALLAELDAETAERIDTANPARVQRAWEVLRATGRGLAAWQADTAPPLLPLERCAALVVRAPKEVLTPRIERRFDAMLADGALEEARAAMAWWDPALPAARAIGAPELIAHLRGETTSAEARERATVAIRRYAKRQRTWARARMKAWREIPMSGV